MELLFTGLEHANALKTRETCSHLAMSISKCIPLYIICTCVLLEWTSTKSCKTCCIPIHEALLAALRGVCMVEGERRVLY